MAKKRKSNHRIYLADDIFRRLQECKSVLEVSTYGEVVKFLLDLMDEGEATVTVGGNVPVTSFRSTHGEETEQSEGEATDPISDHIATTRTRIADGKETEESDLLFVPSPLKKPRLNDQRNLNKSNTVSTATYCSFYDSSLYGSVPYDDLYQSTILDLQDCTYEPTEGSNTGTGSDEEFEETITLGPAVSTFAHDDEESEAEEQSSPQYESLRQYCLVDVSQLKMLWESSGQKKCSICNGYISSTYDQVGSCIIFKKKCVYDHVAQSWSTQIRLRNNVSHGDLVLGASILFSGNNFAKIQLLSKFLNMKILSRSSYYRFQSGYYNQVIERKWNSLMQMNRVQQRDKHVIVLGDGRMDSPGFSANFCTYTFMDGKTMDILDMQVIDKREVNLKSTNMEKEGFIRGLEDIQKDLSVVEVVTDAHSQIAKLVREQYPHLRHTFDIWHGAKNLAKKINMASKKKDCGVLMQWIRPIVNHFWYSIQTSDSFIAFKSKWKSVLHHVSGSHEWVVGDGGLGRCDHEEEHEDQDKELIVANSTAHKSLRKIIWDDMFLKKIPFFINFRSTATIENVNELILMYASKRFGFQFPGYRSRCYLAAIDYSNHKDRALLYGKDGQPRLKRKFNRNSNRWTVFQERIPKQYTYIPELLHNVVLLHEETKSLKLPGGLSDEDPRLISPTIAPIPAPPSKALYEDLKSRFS